MVCWSGQPRKGVQGSAWNAILSILRALDEQWADKRVKSGLSSGEGLIWSVRDPVEKQEAIRGASKQITGYQPVIEDPGEIDKRLMVIEPEFASVLRVAERDGSTLSTQIRQAFDTGNLQTLTQSPFSATRAHISIIGHITKDELLEELSRTDRANGFANHFLWVCVRRSKFLPEGGNFPGIDFAPLNGQFVDAAEFLRRAGELTRDQEAREMWAEEVFVSY